VNNHKQKHIYTAYVFGIEDKIHDEEVGVNGKLNYRGKREN